MKILHVFDHSIPLHSGYTFRSRSILREQQKLGWHTFHITSPKQGRVKQPSETIDNLLFYRSDELSSWQQKIPLLNQWFVISLLKKRLKEVVEEIKPDIIHAHSPALNGVATIRIGRQFNIPVVYEIRAFWEDAAVDHGTSKELGWRYKLTRALETYVIKNAQAVTTICEGLKKDIIARGIAEDKVTVIPNAVDIDKFSISDSKDPELVAKYNLVDHLVLGFVGSFYAYEGLALLLEAVPIIIKQLNNIKVLLVGGGPEEQRLRQQVIDLDIEQYVVFTGRVDHSVVQNYYDLIDILIYPRLSMRLTELVTPLKPLEAMAQKKLFIASDVGGHKELITDGVNGVLFSAGRVQELVDAVSSLANNQENWEGYKQAGREFVEKERNWAVSVHNYSSIYTRLKSNKSI